MSEDPICAECGKSIDRPAVAVRMAQQVDTAPRDFGAAQWRDGLVFQHHVDCAPRELVGVWRRVD